MCGMGLSLYMSISSSEAISNAPVKQEPQHVNENNAIKLNLSYVIVIRIHKTHGTFIASIIIAYFFTL